MTTTQLLIICLTVLLLAVVWARSTHLSARMAIEERTRGAELDAAEKIRSLERERLREEERQLRLADLPPVAPATELGQGATLAVHFDGRVVQGTLEASDAGTLVLSDAKLVTGSQVQPLGGRQHIPRARVTQVQEL